MYSNMIMLILKGKVSYKMRNILKVKIKDKKEILYYIIIMINVIVIIY
jgi:hypothetical protein